MLEGRGTISGWLIVGLAAFALVAFTGLLYIRGGSGSPIALTGIGPTQSPGSSAPPSGKPSPSSSGAAATGAAGASVRPSASRVASPAVSPASATPTSVVAGATSRPSANPSKTPKPSPSPTGPAASYRLPSSPQPATVALENGQGGCPSFPTGGVLVETSFTYSGSRLTAMSPSKHRLSGTLKGDGSFNLSGQNPVEQWIGTLTDTGGTGSYFVVSNGCTEGYGTTIAFHP